MRGVRRIMLQAATGAGKTRIASAITAGSKALGHTVRLMPPA